MAGYRTSGDDFVNATAINTQIKKQREAYNATSRQTLDFLIEDPGAGMGIARSTTPLFSMPNDIMADSVEVFRALDLSSNQPDSEHNLNPDFPGGVNLSNDEATNIFNDFTNEAGNPLKSDKPNKKGPNLIAPSINNPSLTTEGSSTSQFTNGGFGWKDSRNEPNEDAAIIGTYFSRHYKFDDDDLSKPVLGESKSPVSDTNIDYNQPD